MSSNNQQEKHYQHFQPYIQWFSGVAEQLSSDHKDQTFPLPELPQPKDNPISSFFSSNNTPIEHQVTLLALIINYYFPEQFIPFLKLFTNEASRGMVGGKLNEHTKLYEPGLQTMVFILSCRDQSLRLKYSLALEEANNTLFTDGIIDYKYKDYRGLSAPIELNEDYRLALMGQIKPRLDSGDNFPARLAETKLEYDDVILSDTTQEGLTPLLRYLKIRKQLRENEELHKLSKPCFMAVFSGFPGTGKTIAAKTIGKLYNMPTYTLELSRVVSKYIGEFEKAMDKVFTRFSGKDCILFIDEADSIFTKRLENISEAKDKYVNQEMAYLLQRIEEYDGVIILASNVSNFKQQIDNAMLRRIRSFIQFPFPLFGERKKMWENALPKSFSYEPGLTEKISENFQLTGASIYNIVSELVLYVVGENIETVTFDIIKIFIEADFRKRDITMRPCKDNENPQTVMAQRVGKQVMATGKRM